MKLEHKVIDGSERLRDSARSARFLALAFAMLLGACGQNSDPAAGGSEVELSAALAYRDGDPTLTVVSPAPGAVLTSPFFIEVETENFELGPAGQTTDGRGHLHVLVNEDCHVPGVVIPDDQKNPHGDFGQRRLRVDLPPGRHRLCVQASDGFHVAVSVQHEIEVEIVRRTSPGVPTE